MSHPHSRRRSFTVREHELFINSLLTPTDLDDLDAELDEHIEIDPFVTGTNSRRSDRELADMLALIDNLPISENGKEGQL